MIVRAKNLNFKEIIVFARHQAEEREPSEIGISSIKASSMMSKHEVIFARDNGIVKVSHQ